MNQLTSRERVLRLLRGEPIDRIPISPRIFEPFVYQFHRTTKIEDMLAAVYEVYRHFKFDIIDWNCTPSPHFEWWDMKTEGPNWHPEVRIEKKGETTHEIITIKTPKGELRQVFSITQMTETEREMAMTEVPIKTEKDFDIMEEFMPEPPIASYDCSSVTRAKKMIGDDGIATPSYHGPFNILAICWRKIDELLLDIHINPDLFHRMMRKATDRCIQYGVAMAKAGADMFDIGTNLANGRLVSGDFLAEHIMPYENELADALQGMGCPCLYHNCGYAAAHLSVYNQLHHKLWGYMAPPPHGDVDHAEVIRTVPKELILWGGLDQIDFLRQATPAEVAERTKKLIELFKPRGNYILGTTDYLETNTPHANLEAFVETGLKYGWYD